MSRLFPETYATPDWPRKVKQAFDALLGRVATLEAGGGGGGGVTDGDKGDVVVSGSGATWTVDSGAVTYAKMQDVSAASRLLGRGDSGAGDAQEITLGAGLSMAGTVLSASGGTSSWASITGKPATFPPETPQAISHITGLQTALDGKQASGSYAQGMELEVEAGGER